MTEQLVRDSVPKRVFMLYGLYTLLTNASFLFAHYFLPEGLMKGSPTAEFVAQQSNFLLHFGETFAINFFIIIAFGVVMNLLVTNQNIPLGYTIIGARGIMSGLLLGTNSLMSSLSEVSLIDGITMGLSIGEIEVLGMVIIIASTANIALFREESSFWAIKTRFSKLKSFREIRFSTQELIGLAIGVSLLLLGAYNETVMWFSSVAN